MIRPTGSKDELEARRRRAVDLLELGQGVREVAEVVGDRPGSVSRWKAAYKEEGEEGLAAKPRTNGRTPKLAEEHYPALEELLLEGPEAHGFETNLWTLNRITEIIEREFDVSVSSSSVWRYLQKMGWSCQKPERRAREHDEEEIRRWMTETWPAIKKRGVRNTRSCLSMSAGSTWIRSCAVLGPHVGRHQFSTVGRAEDDSQCSPLS